MTSTGRTTIYLVRHAARVMDDQVLVGRLPGIGLSELGRRQARELARGAWARHVALVHSSPRQRAVETAAIIAAELGRHVIMASAVDEVDFGTWTGRTFAELESDPGWRAWNAARHLARTPSGETMEAIARRAWRHLRELHRRNCGKSIAVVTHAEVIRSVVMRANSMPFRDWHRVNVPVASVTAVHVGSAESTVASPETTIATDVAQGYGEAAAETRGHVAASAAMMRR